MGDALYCRKMNFSCLYDLKTTDSMDIVMKHGQTNKILWVKNLPAGWASGINKQVSVKYEKNVSFSDLTNAKDRASHAR